MSSFKLVGSMHRGHKRLAATGPSPTTDVGALTLANDQGDLAIADSESIDQGGIVVEFSETIDLGALLCTNTGNVLLEEIIDTPTSTISVEITYPSSRAATITCGSSPDGGPGGAKDISSTLNASLQTSIPPTSHSTSQTSSEMLVEVLVPMLAISIFGILWIMRRRVAGIFHCFSRKRYFFRRYGKLDDIESAQIRASWRISSTDTLVSRPFRFTMTKDETRGGSFASDETPTRPSILQVHVPSKGPEKKVTSVASPFDSPKGSKAVPDHGVNTRITTNLVGSNDFSSSAVPVPISSPIRNEHHEVSVLRNDVMRLQTELSTLRTEMIEQLSAVEVPPLYDHLSERGPGSS